MGPAWGDFEAGSAKSGFVLRYRALGSPPFRNGDVKRPMAAHYLDFERPIADLESKIEELSRLSETAGPGAFESEIQALRDRAQQLRK